jgi:hypothetical protein
MCCRALAAPLLSVYLSLARPLPVTTRDMLARWHLPTKGDSATMKEFHRRVCSMGEKTGDLRLELLIVLGFLLSGITGI